MCLQFQDMEGTDIYLPLYVLCMILSGIQQYFPRVHFETPWIICSALVILMWMFLTNM